MLNMNNETNTEITATETEVEVPNPYQNFHRAVKAARLADLLSSRGINSYNVWFFTAWDEAALILDMNPPSEATREMVVGLLA